MKLPFPKNTRGIQVLVNLGNDRSGESVRSGNLSTYESVFYWQKVIMQNMFSAEGMALFGKEVLFEIYLSNMERNSAIF